jgi:hypothetical protein
MGTRGGLGKIKGGRKRQEERNRRKQVVKSKE